MMRDYGKQSSVPGELHKPNPALKTPDARPQGRLGFRPSVSGMLPGRGIKRDFLIFAFCGAMGTLTNFIFSLVISNWLDASWAYGTGYILSLLVAYRLNALLIYKEPPRLRRFLKFVVAYLPNFLILFTLVMILLRALGLWKVLVYGLAAVVALPVNFLMVRMYAFRDRRV